MKYDYSTHTLTVEVQTRVDEDRCSYGLTWDAHQEVLKNLMTEVYRLHADGRIGDGHVMSVEEAKREY